MPSSPRNPSLLILSTLSSLLSLLSLCHSMNDQGQALLQWKHSLNTSSLSSWHETDSFPCTWQGLKCDANNQVTHISLDSLDLSQSSLPLPLLDPLRSSLTTLVLSSTNLSGSIPAELGGFSELVFVDLSENSLTGHIPSELCKLRKIQTLSLNTNFLEGTIPECIGNLSLIEYLTLYDNLLSGSVPGSIGELRGLRVFRAGGNKNLKGEIPHEIGNCKELTVLGLAETGISGSLPSSVGRLVKLETLALYTCLLSGSIPESIGNCTGLKNLYLYQNSLSGPIPRSIGRLSKLESLLLWQNSLVGTIPEEIGGCGEVKVLDFSENLLTGSIPKTFGDLPRLEELQLSVNKLSGSIPSEIANCESLTHLELDNNAISGEIPARLGELKRLTLFFAWQNNLTGSMPESLADCEELQALDLSYNSLNGQIPGRVFGLRNLTKLLLLSNDLSGFVPPDIGNCSNLYRLRLNQNRIGGTIPSEIGNLKSLNFVDLSDNLLVGSIPESISECRNLEFLDLHANGLSGSIPESLPKSLQFVDMSRNRLYGELPRSIGSLSELIKLSLGSNALSGSIPSEIEACKKLQLLNLGENRFTGEIPRELGQMPELGISLNLSCNNLSGRIPTTFSGLEKLAVLDISHNSLSGELTSLASLINLVALNVSFNDLSGRLPDTPFFRKLPLSDLASNKGLYISENGLVSPDDTTTRQGSPAMKLLMSVLIGASAVLVFLAVYVIARTRIAARGGFREGDANWEITFYQKLEVSIDDIVKHLTSSNVIGTGSSGVVYRVTLPNGDSMAVKKMWSSEESGAFGSEIRTLGAIRHKNIIRLLGWGSNRNVKLLFYDYLPNGSLSSMLHGAAKVSGSEWESRFEVVLGVAHALAYLHHDCLPPIMHGDVKAMNVLLGGCNEPFLADFGLARVVSNGESEDGSNVDVSKPQQPQRPHLAGSYGYMAPEHGSMQRITEKSDIYSFGVVLLEILTGRHPLDPTLPGGTHMVQWVRHHLAAKKDPCDILDTKLRGRSDPTVHEMLQTLAVSFLCIANKPDERPTMKDVVAMLKEIRHVESLRPDVELSKRVLSSIQSSPPPPQPPNKIMGSSQPSSNCSFAFSDDSMSH